MFFQADINYGLLHARVYQFLWIFRSDFAKSATADSRTFHVFYTLFGGRLRHASEEPLRNMPHRYQHRNQ